MNRQWLAVILVGLAARGATADSASASGERPLEPPPFGLIASPASGTLATASAVSATVASPVAPSSTSVAQPAPTGSMPGSPVPSATLAMAPAPATTLAGGPAASATVPEPALKLSGNRSTTLRYQHYAGLPSQASGFYQSGFTRHETTRLKVSGQTLETVKIEGEIYQSDVDLDNQYSLKLATHDLELFLGEFPATLEGSEFSVFNRQVQGARLKGEIPLTYQPEPKLTFTAIGAAPRGASKYEKFFGNNTQGPYQLASFPVVIGSESVLVDKVKQVRNDDYEINFLTGQLTFKKRIVESRSLIEVTYSSRQTLYQRSLYAGQVGYQFSGDDTVGLSLADERDKAAPTIAAASGTPPSAQSVLGTTFKHNGEFLRVGGEYALSAFNPNELVGSPALGNAYRGNVEVERFGVTLGADGKRLEPRFRTMGNTALGQDLTDWSAHGGWKPVKAVSLEGRHEQQRTILNGQPDRTLSTDAKTVIAPAGYPKASYRFFQSEENFQASFDRLERRHTADLSQGFKHLTVGGGYEREEITSLDGTQPDSRWNAAKANAALQGIPWVTASADTELRQGSQSSSLLGTSSAYRALLAGTNVGLNPSDRYHLTAANHWQRTSGQPDQNTLRTEAKAKPVDAVSTEASYSQETLQTTYAGAATAAHADTYAGLAEVKPLRAVDLLYQPSLHETVIAGAPLPSNADRKDVYTAKWAAGSVASVEGGYTRDQYRLRDTTDPAMHDLTRQDTGTWNGAMRLAPLKALAVELTYADKQDDKDQFNLASPTGYDSRSDRTQTAQIGLKPQLESKLGLSASYRFEQVRQGGSQGAATSLPTYTVSPLAQQVQSFALLNDYSQRRTWEHTANGELSYQWFKSLISTVNAAWDRMQDRLGLVPNVTTLSAGAGLTLRFKVVQAGLTYRMARASSGAGARQEALSGNLDVVPDSRVRWTNRVEYSTGAGSTGAATDATSGLEVSF